MKYQSFFRTAGCQPDLAPGTRERMLEALVEHTPECVKLISREGLLLDMNAAGLAMIEADDWESVQGANVYDLMAPEHRDRFREFNERVCAGHKESLEFEIIALKETRRWMQSTAVPFVAPNQEIVHLAITRDVTQDKRRELELERAKEAAEVANRTTGEFLANVSHELRTPMTAILGFSDLLLDRCEGPDQRQFASTIKRNGSHLLELINDILDLSKVKAGKLDFEETQCSPRQLVNAVIEAMQVRADENGVDLQSTFRDPLAQAVRTDPTRLRQILINLVGNALKFTESGSVKVNTELLPLETEQADAKFAKLRVTVTDTGIGMTESQIESLFRPFVQADATTTRKYGGTGLGLTISRRLARRLGGNIEATSKVGVGSTFVVEIKVGLETDKRIGASAPTDDKCRMAAVSLAGLHVLLAEDGIDNQRLISCVLQNAGAKVTSVVNGREALDAIRKSITEDRPFDVVLMDMQMPVMDGYEATRQLCQDDCPIPVIALTANAMEGDREKCLAAGCDDFLSKPIDRSILVNAVQRWAAPETHMANL